METPVSERGPLLVSKQQCLKVADRLRPIQVKVLFPEPPLKEKRLRANFWFYLIAISHKTGSLQGVIDGRPLRGWDYLYASAERAYRRDPNLFTANRVLRLIPQDLRHTFSDQGDPETSTLDRVGERLHLLREVAASLLHEYNGDVWTLYERSGGKLCGGTGLLNLLAQFEAYRDPLRKKAYLLLIILSTSKIWTLKDPDALKFPVDNHLMRVALRTGMIRIEEEGFRERLKGKGEVAAEEERAVREAVEGAGDLLLQASGRTLFELDTILWHIGRSCCFYDNSPICGPRVTIHPCSKRDNCSLMRDTDYPCPDACPLDGTCLGSLDEAYAALMEPKVETHFY